MSGELLNFMKALQERETFDKVETCYDWPHFKGAILRERDYPSGRWFLNFMKAKEFGSIRMRVFCACKRVDWSRDSNFEDSQKKWIAAVDTAVLENLYWLLRFTSIKGRKQAGERREDRETAGLIKQFAISHAMLNGCAFEHGVQRSPVFYNISGKYSIEVQPEMLSLLVLHWN